MQSYYELLEVSVSASQEQIRDAYQRLCEQYADDQVALYGLADPAQAKALRARLLEAMEILTDDDLRGEYDRDLGLPPRSKPMPPPASLAAEDDEVPSAQLAMNDLLQGADVQSTHPFVPFAYVPAPSRPSMLPPMASSTVEVPASSPPAPPMPPVVVPVSASMPDVVAAPLVTPPPLPPRPRPSPGQAPQMAESGAIAEAETALAKVSAHAQQTREARASAPRPKPMEIPPDAEFNGELLRKVRTAAGLSLQQVAERTRIGARHIENVEADRYSDLPAPVYLRGMLMNISRELGLDGIRVSKSYLALAEAAKAKG